MSEKYTEMTESGGEKADSSEKESSVKKETEETAMSQEISSSQIDVEMDSQNPDESQKDELLLVI